MTSKAMRVLNIISGVLLIAIGIYCLLGMGFSCRYYSDDCRIHLHDGSVGQHNSCRYDGGTCVPAGRRQFDYLCLYSENKITCWKQCSGAVYRTAKL